MERPRQRTEILLFNRIAINEYQFLAGTPLYLRTYHNFALTNPLSFFIAKLLLLRTLTCFSNEMVPTPVFRHSLISLYAVLAVAP